MRQNIRITPIVCHISRYMQASIFDYVKVMPTSELSMSEVIKELVLIRRKGQVEI